jgi:hypothetical protein
LSNSKWPKQGNSTPQFVSVAQLPQQSASQPLSV